MKHDFSTKKRQDYTSEFEQTGFLALYPIFPRLFFYRIKRKKLGNTRVIKLFLKKVYGSSIPGPPRFFANLPIKSVEPLILQGFLNMEYQKIDNTHCIVADYLVLKVRYNKKVLKVLTEGSKKVYTICIKFDERQNRY